MDPSNMSFLATSCRLAPETSSGSQAGSITSKEGFSPAKNPSLLTVSRLI